MTRLSTAVGVFLLTLLLAESASAQHANPKLRPGAAMCAISASHAAAPSPRDEELPWCVSADDPRCAPLHHDSAPLRVASRPPMATAADAFPQPEFANSHPTLTPHTGLVPRPGVSHRVERPPRAIGRSL